jgi:asparagine synthetase B (glutamine-hydrolysing)
MTDLTILIAVIALALWPLAFLVLRIRHERKKRRDRLDRMTKEDLEDIGTEELVIAVLKKIGCQPETNEEGHIVFKYQGEFRNLGSLEKTIEYTALQRTQTLKKGR